MKTVVILQPQTGTKPRRSEREQGENIDNNATGQMTWTGRGPGPYRQRQGDTEKDVSVNLKSSGKTDRRQRISGQETTNRRLARDATQSRE